MNFRKPVFIQLWFCTVCCAGIYAQTPSRLFSEVLERARTTSLYRDRVNWDSLHNSLMPLINHIDSLDALAPYFTRLLEALGDEHGRFLYRNQVVAWYYGGTLKPHQSHFDAEQYRDIQGGVLYPLLSAMVDETTGYLRLPGMSMGDNTQMALDLQRAICDLQQQGAIQWILDLRYNGGGNLNPMAEGLTLLLDEGPWGGAKGADPAQDVIWEIRDGDFYNRGYSIGLDDACHRSPDVSMAVLTSLYTASSGEALAVMLKGRPNTRFFGEETLGMVTGTGWDVFDGEVIMSISVNYFMDRNGKVYRDFVGVDERIPFTPGIPLEQDEAIHAALQWLRSRQ